MSKKLTEILCVFAAFFLLTLPVSAEEKTGIPSKEIELWRETGIDYYTGEQRFIRQNYETARGFFEKAGAEGDAISLYYLGNMYNEGLSVDKDEDKAKLYYKRAAELGHADSQMLTGVFLIIDGIAQRNREYQQEMFRRAVEWLEKATKQGNMEAAFWLGDMLRKGLGAEKDEKRGISLLRASSDSGNPNAQAMLGALYWKGQSGIEKDLMKAHALMSKSVRGDNPQAVNLLELIEAEMTEEQRKTATELSKKAAAEETKKKTKNRLPR